MDFRRVKQLIIPEGTVKELKVGNIVLWTTTYQPIPSFTSSQIKVSMYSSGTKDIDLGLTGCSPSDLTEWGLGNYGTYSKSYSTSTTNGNSRTDYISAVSVSLKKSDNEFYLHIGKSRTGTVYKTVSLNILAATAYGSASTELYLTYY